MSLSDIKALMFSGIVESCQAILATKNRDQVVEIRIQRPASFDDIKKGDSIAVNGVCLTVEDFDNETMQFALGLETQKITAWQSQNLEGMLCNLERSLRFNARIHGYLVSGHVDTLGEITKKELKGENLVFNTSIPKNLKPYIWQKGGICINGVSLTINSVTEDGEVSVTIIPETLKQTNLKNIEVGDLVNLEADYMAKALHRFWELKNESH